MEENDAIELLKRYVDFLIRPKTKEDTENIMDFILLKISSYSHTAYSEEANNFYRGQLGHSLRKKYRTAIAKEIRKYIKEKLS